VLPDGRLASGSWRNTIRLWDVNTGAETAHLEGHSEWVTALCVLLDGGLASAAYDKTFRLWDTVTRNHITCLEIDAWIKCAATLPNRCLVAGDDLGRLHRLEIID
jgi:WD40 repeat protein